MVTDIFHLKVKFILKYQMQKDIIVSRMVS